MVYRIYSDMKCSIKYQKYQKNIIEISKITKEFNIGKSTLTLRNKKV